MKNSVVFVLTLYMVCVSSTTASNKTCGKLPAGAFGCFKKPLLFLTDDKSSRCFKTNDLCDEVSCIFKKYDFLKNGKLDRTNLEAYYDNFALDNNEWTNAIRQSKAECLKQDLPPQNIYLNCSAVDVLDCTHITFMKVAKPDQWSSSAECREAREFIATCPVCPDKCFEGNVPQGACSSCKP